MVYNWKLVLFTVIISNTISYFSIREILWSILWLNKRGKYRHFLDYKRILRQSESFMKRISMSYLLPQISIAQNDFIAWRKVKIVFVLVESILVLSYSFLGIFGVLRNHGKIYFYFSTFIMLQSVIVFFYTRLQFRFGRNGKETRYDILRKDRRP